MAGISLRDYQLDAVDQLRNGCILCGGVGSGKSRTALGYYYKEQGGRLDTKNYVRMSNPKDLYIITTARKRDDKEWEGELVPFLLSTNPDISIYKNKVVVDSWNNIQKYADVTDAFFIFDEQRVVGYGAWSKAFIKIAKANDWILLSATPGDKWEDYIPVFIANGFYRNKTEFAQEHLVYSPYIKYKVDRYVGLKRLERLRDRILIDMDFDRKTVSHHEDVFVSYDIPMYKDVVRTRTDPFNKGHIPCKPNDIGSLLIGRDIDISDVSVMPGWPYIPRVGGYVRLVNKPIKSASELCYVWRKVVNTDDSRQTALLQIFEKHPRMIVFYNFDYELEILKGMYYGDDVEVAEWNGHKHNPVPDSERWVYLVQYTAGAEGWNCIKTDTIVFYSQNYSYKIMEQSAGRIDRLNTPYTDLYYYHLKSRSGIDAAISRAISNKKKFNERKFTKWDQIEERVPDRFAA